MSSLREDQEYFEALAADSRKKGGMHLRADKKANPELYAISTTRTSQGWECATIKNGARIHMHYIGYSKREAIAAFRIYARID